MLNFLYKKTIGRILLRPLVGRWFSSVGGFFLNTSLSKLFINGFIKKNDIDVSQFITDDIHSFNDFFVRKIRPGARPIDGSAQNLIAPCDGKLTVYQIDDDTVIPVKQSVFSIEKMLMEENLSKKFKGGLCLVFRLTVDDYHRYSYVETGTKSQNVHISGKYHTVRPIALEQVPVFTENEREYTVITTYDNVDILQMEVGAMLVGKIKNNVTQPCAVKRGEEKGMFMFGGSTVILLLGPDTVKINDNIISLSLKGFETPVKLGEAIGTYVR